jgi:hypothetical protein
MKMMSKGSHYLTISAIFDRDLTRNGEQLQKICHVSPLNGMELTALAFPQKKKKKSLGIFP